MKPLDPNSLTINCLLGGCIDPKCVQIMKKTTFMECNERILQLKDILAPYHFMSYMSGDQIDECIEILHEAKRLLELHHTGEVK